MRNCVHAKGQLFLRIFLQFFSLWECLGNHFTLLNAFWLIIASSNDSCIERKEFTLDYFLNVLEHKMFCNSFFCLCMFVSYLNQVRFQMRIVAFVQTQVLIAMPVPNIEKRLIFPTSKLGLFLMAHSGIGLLVWWAIVTLASHLF